MLVIGRRNTERVRIGDDIIVTIIDRRGQFTRVGIEAPKHIPVHREEIYQKIQAGNGTENKLPPTPAETLEAIRTLCLSRNNASVNLGAHQLASDVLKIIGGGE